jgi:hypothetical protein
MVGRPLRSGVAFGLWLAASAIVALVSYSVQAEPDTCKTWRADVIDSRTGKKTGDVLSMKDDRASIEAASARAVRSAASLCRYWGPQTSDCFSKVGTPYCADTPSKPTSARSFTVRVERRCVTASGLVKGSLLVNGKLLGDVGENANLLIAPGMYGGHLRSGSAHENMQGDFGTLGRTGGDFLLEVDGVRCANGTPRTGLELHGGTKASDSTGCVLLGGMHKDNGIRSIPDIDTHLLAQLRTEFYGTRLPGSTPDRDIKFEFGQPDRLPSCH